MQNHYLQKALNSSLTTLIQKLLPDHNCRNIFDLFNSELFYDFLMQIIEGIPKLSNHLDALRSSVILKQSQGQDQHLSLQSIKLKNFLSIVQIIKSCFEYLQISMFQFITSDILKKMIQKYDCDILQILIEYMFDLMLLNPQILQYINDEMNQYDKEQIFEFIQAINQKRINQQEVEKQKGKNKKEERQNKLIEQILELENEMDKKQNQIQGLRSSKQKIEEQFEEIKIIECERSREIEILKNKLSAYDEIDLLLQQKDEEISKLHKEIQSIQLKNKMLMADLTHEKNKSQQKANEMESKLIQNHEKLEKALGSYEILLKQIEEKQISYKIAKSNLTEKNKSLQQKIKKLQEKMAEIQVSKMLKDKEYMQLSTRFDSLKSQSIIRQKTSTAEKMFDRLLQTTTHIQPEKLGDQINQIDNDFEKLKIEERAEGQKNQNLRKIEQIILQNRRLKEKLALIQSKGIKTINEENQKLKKRIIVLKRKNDQIQIQRKQQIEVMVSSFENYLRLVKNDF